MTDFVQTAFNTGKISIINPNKLSLVNGEKGITVQITISIGTSDKNIKKHHWMHKY